MSTEGIPTKDGLSKKIQRNNAVSYAIQEGIAVATHLGLSKPYDIALSVLTQIEKAGFRFVRVGVHRLDDSTMERVSR